MIDKISISGGVPTNLPNLFLIVLVSMIKDGYEDYQRYLRDEEENQSSVKKYNTDTNKFEEKQWKDIFVGDIVAVTEDCPIPADLALLSSANPKGQCFVETKNFDGETNLKTRHVPREIMDLIDINQDDSFKNLTGTVTCEIPNTNPHKFVGRVKINDTREISLSNDNMLLRGCILRNT